ncbi:type I restriction endonuclease subunit R, EcoR124 family, partial [Streptococcus pyogenes]
EKANFDMSLAQLQDQISDQVDVGIDIESANIELLKKFAKAYQEFDKYFASIQVYSEYNQEEVFAQAGLTEEILENYTGT